MKQFLKKYAGVVIGALYAFILRLVFNTDSFDIAFSLFSLTFVGLVPIVIGLIPLLYASKEQLKSWSYRITSPVWTVVVFFTFCFMTGIEDLICIWVIMVPYVLVAATVGLIAGEITERIKNKRRTLFSIILLPFIVSPVEQQFNNIAGTYSVVTKVTVNASPETIWGNIIRVRDIKEDEYTKGFFNYAGIPRPLYAELDKDTIGATRVGHFEGGLKFIEKVTTWNRNRHIGFDISVVPSSIRQTVFDQHILKGDHFKFLQADYMLMPLANGQTELTLRSSYQLNTKINAYASYYGDQLLTDFQERLLQVIKKRCDDVRE